MLNRVHYAQIGFKLSGCDIFAWGRCCFESIEQKIFPYFKSGFESATHLPQWLSYYESFLFPAHSIILSYREKNIRSWKGMFYLLVSLCRHGLSRSTLSQHCQYVKTCFPLHNNHSKSIYSYRLFSVEPFHIFGSSHHPWRPTKQNCYSVHSRA